MHDMPVRTHTGDTPLARGYARARDAYLRSVDLHVRARAAAHSPTFFRICVPARGLDRVCDACSGAQRHVRRRERASERARGNAARERTSEFALRELAVGTVTSAWPFRAFETCPFLTRLSLLCFAFRRMTRGIPEGWGCFLGVSGGQRGFGGSIGGRGGQGGRFGLWNVSAVWNFVGYTVLQVVERRVVERSFDKF